MVLYKEYYDEAVERLKSIPEKTFAACGLDKAGTLDDTDAMYRLWALFQKNVSEYDCEPDDGFRIAVSDAFGLKLS